MSPAQLGLDIGQALAAGSQQYQDMIEQIGGLLDDTLVALTFGCDDYLDRFLADLLKDLILAIIQQAVGIGAFDWMRLAILDQREQLI
jgi:hypothetical protein